jgi:hypothetical protein
MLQDVRRQGIDIQLVDNTRAIPELGPTAAGGDMTRQVSSEIRVQGP